ncbi:unnamed protein product [Bursaphelenchus xylophilus]|uniref:(pine wood nematode) hypothetical protein n=1 Tax=Bursaphelenchus xylophilus TaxID=6326 RepID=A0A1I7S938_BURXY|nr:unnamed protein product [Bursaphelenchus xylophilus]CAG9086224.1 unnamed protein product [Bursaphelenchus xylophilus]
MFVVNTFIRKFEFSEAVIKSVGVPVKASLALFIRPKVLTLAYSLGGDKGRDLSVRDDEIFKERSISSPVFRC